jgi:hypothetical protein
MEEKAFGLVELSPTETKKIEGGLAVPELDWCAINRWAHDICIENDLGNEAWHLDQWYKQNCNGIN